MPLKGYSDNSELISYYYVCIVARVTFILLSFLKILRKNVRTIFIRFNQQWFYVTDIMVKGIK